MFHNPIRCQLRRKGLNTIQLSMQGQTLMEVVVVSMVGILVVTALTFATIFSLRNASSAKLEAQAVKLAQEGIERVRTGRDRNSNIKNISDAGVTSWDGSSSTTCPGTAKTDSIWCYPIYSSCSNALNPNCYFNLSTTGDTGTLNFLGNGSSFPVSGTELIPPNFKRVVILSDDDTYYPVQKTVTVIVQWTDFAGPHESKLSTILRRL